MAKRILVKGMVQGVGFRPFVYGLATRLNLHGWVRNTSGGVEIVINGQNCSQEEFIRALALQKPPLARIDALEVNETEGDLSSEFEIRASYDIDGAYLPISADIGICPDCERELFHPKNRRYLHPFISCTRCGPRFTIIKDIPYDRPNTTMAKFPMCARCRAEYANPLDRRFHAETIACPECGPFVELRETHSIFPTSAPRISSIEIRTSAILKARRLLREGYIVAIKGLGGFHLACDASNPYTVAELRDRKGRSDKSFAVMAANIAAAASICQVSRQEQRLLTGWEKPIVLLKRNDQNSIQPYKISELVAPGLDTLGVMLPYTALHHLLLNQTDPVLAREPVPPILVMTSSNLREEPIGIDNEEALLRLAPLADAFLLHDRDIHIRCDDSVVKVDHAQTIYLRRSRGYAPYPVELPFEVRPTLAVGGQLKNTFCLTRDDHAFLSHHIGDMRTSETHKSFEEGIQHLSHIFRIQPELIAYDLAPDYFATRYALQTGSHVERVGVQHHHAHIASCMADNGLSNRRLIGLAFDGGGYGTDGAIWGGEVLLASYAGFERFAHLEYLPLARDTSPLHTAVSYADALRLHVDDLPFLQNMDQPARVSLKNEIVRGGQPCSSMRRLFDVVSSLAGIRNETGYDAQALREMEVLSRSFVSNGKAYPYLLDETQNGFVVRLRDLLAAVIEDVRANQAAGLIGARLHRTMAEIAIALCKQARSATHLNEVALSGGIWQNLILLNLVREGLEQEKFTVYFHQQVPANDGGLALGQAVVANFRIWEHGELQGHKGTPLRL